MYSAELTCDITFVFFPNTCSGYGSLCSSCLYCKGGSRTCLSVSSDYRWVSGTGSDCNSVHRLCWWNCHTWVCLVLSLLNWRAEKQSELTHKYWIYPPNLKYSKNLLQELLNFQIFVLMHIGYVLHFVQFRLFPVPVFDFRLTHYTLEPLLLYCET